MSHYYPLPVHFPVRHPMVGVENFTQGLVAAGCVSAFQDVVRPDARLQGRRVLRHALQGGTALAAGAYAAEAVRCGDFTRAVLATAVGAAGVYALERLLKEPASVESAPALQDASHE
ncbi:MAG: hypothetical protein ACKN9W_01800 [Methylococcus sp.]